MRPSITGRAATAMVSLTLLAACSGASSTPRSSPSTSPRPSSPAKVAIVAPHDGQVVHGRTVTVHLSLRDAQVVTVTTRNIRPDRGHIHLTLDGKVVSTNYGLTQTLNSISPGPHELRAEFVAADHIPFNPRVFTQIAFEDKS